jgi:hypothetical protein
MENHRRWYRNDLAWFALLRIREAVQERSAESAISAIIAPMYLQFLSFGFYLVPMPKKQTQSKHEAYYAFKYR